MNIEFIYSQVTTNTTPHDCYCCLLSVGCINWLFGNTFSLTIWGKALCLQLVIHPSINYAACCAEGHMERLKQIPVDNGWNISTGGQHWVTETNHGHIHTYKQSESPAQVWLDSHRNTNEMAHAYYGKWGPLSKLTNHYCNWIQHTLLLSFWLNPSLQHATISVFQWSRYPTWCAWV